MSDKLINSQHNLLVEDAHDLLDKVYTAGIADGRRQIHREGLMLSVAYLRLRELIPSAFNTPQAPTPEQVWKTTEDALKELRKQAGLTPEPV